MLQKYLKTILGSKSLHLDKNGELQVANLIKSVKIHDFDPKIVDNIFKIICILTVAKNYTSNFSHIPSGPNYGTTSKASLMATSK